MTSPPLPASDRPQRPDINDPGGAGPPTTHGVAGRPGMAYRHVTSTRW
jgi:hypothetical protein